MEGFEVGVLGPLAVRIGGVDVVVPGPKQRYLLAALALQPGRIVPVPALIDAVWGDGAPDGADHTLQQHVSAVRKLLAAAVPDGGTRLATRRPGYALEVDVLDATAFEADAAAGRAALAVGDPLAAATAFERALGRWRGPALADACDTPPLAAAAVHLESQHLGALEGRFDARLACGEAASLVPAIEAVVAQHPFHERFRAQLMLALYRAGRQTDALAAYRSAREALVEELGIEPGTALRDLEQAILEQRPDLEPRTGPVGGVGGGGAPVGLDDADVFRTFRADAAASGGRVELPDGQLVQLADGGLVIGRDPTAPIRLVDNRVSRLHARIDTLAGVSVVRDLGSTNGTQVNGQPVAEHLLVDGDELSIGGVLLRYRTAP